MKRFIPLFAFALLLAACQTAGQSQYVRDMQRYQDYTEAALIDALGPPDNSYAVDGIKYLTYTKASTQVYNNDTSGIGFGTGTYNRGTGVWLNQGFGSSASAYTYRCDVYFAIKNRIVNKVGWRGNNC